MSELENKPLEGLEPELNSQELSAEERPGIEETEVLTDNSGEQMTEMEVQDPSGSLVDMHATEESPTPLPVLEQAEPEELVEPEKPMETIPEAIPSQNLAIEKSKPAMEEKKPEPELSESTETDNEGELEHEEDDDDEIVLADFSESSREELVTILKERLQKVPVAKLKPEVDNIKQFFYRKLKLETEAARKKFVEEGGDIAEFKPEPDAIELEFKDILNNYRIQRDNFRQKIETEKVENLHKKLHIIEEIKGLPNDSDSINKTFNSFRDIQRKWREVGPVPQAELNNLYETYNYHVEKFYDWLKINKELRDLDLRHNLDEKILLCEKAEELLLEPSVVKGFRALQKLHEHWREIGPVPLDKKEEVWTRFKETTAMINKKHQEHFENIRQEQDRNLEAKNLICEKMEELADAGYTQAKDWEETTQEILKLQQLWHTIGFVNKKENNRIFERFRVAADNFFAAKRDFFSGNKEEQSNNLQKKVDLCLQAETLKDSTEWKKTTEDFIRMQKEWKEIGPVPRRQSDVIWKRFRTACDEFFKNKEKLFSNLGDQFEENLKLKQAIIDRLEKFEMRENMEDNLRELKEMQKDWSEIGHVPFKLKDEIQKRFRESINKQFDLLRVDDSRRNLNTYKQRIESGPGRGAPRHMQVERDRIMDTIRQLEGDIALLSNNIGFFAKTKNAEAFIADVNNKIEKARQRILVEKQKLDFLSKSENPQESV